MRSCMSTNSPWPSRKVKRKPPSWLVRTICSRPSHDHVVKAISLFGLSSPGNDVLGQSSANARLSNAQALLAPALKLLGYGPRYLRLWQFGNQAGSNPLGEISDIILRRASIAGALQATCNGRALPQFLVGSALWAIA